MEYATLNNGIKMPMAGIGTFLLTPDEAEASVLSALSCGYRLIDTANAYVNEKAVGRAMKKSGIPREEIFLETKLWPAFYEQADAVEKTLERLDTDYIDLLLIHQPAGNYIAGYKLMEKAYKEGKVKAIGLSNFNEKQIQEILDICEVKPAVLQTEVHPYSQEKELKKFLTKEGMVIQAWYPLGHGDKTLQEEPLFTELGRKYGKGVSVSNVTFEPGCRNNWHIHHDGGQILLCTSGRGYYQAWGEPARELHPGDVVNIPPEVKHWHGAAPDSWFAHVAISVPGSHTEWLEPVDGEEYTKLK